MTFAHYQKCIKKQLLKTIHKALNKDGMFVFDFYNLSKQDSMNETSSFEVESSGFWRPNPYIALNQRFHYEQDHAFLDQHIIIDHKVSVYRFYNHYYEEQDIKKMLYAADFSKVEIYHKLVGEHDIDFIKAFK